MSDESQLIIPLPGERLMDRPVEEALARLVGAPIWDENKTFMLWSQIMGDIDADEPEIDTMFWTPETDEEWTNAHRLYELTHPRPWKEIRDLEHRVKTADLGGEWVIRWVLQWNSWSYLTPLGIQDANDPDSVDDDAEVHSNDPDDSAVLSEREALELVIALTRQEQGEEEDDDELGSYFEAIPRNKANQSNYPYGYVNLD